MQSVEIEFFKPERRRYRSVLHRRDGLVIELDGGGLEAGLCGVLAAGGIFGHAKVITGRRPPHAAKRAQAIVDAAGDRLSQAEMLTRFVCDLALEGVDPDVPRLKTAAGARWSRETTAEQLSGTCRALREASVSWRDLRVGEALRVSWRLPPFR